jgi:hypothetical protein
MVVHACNPSYLGDRGRRIINLAPAGARLMRTYLKLKIQNKSVEGMAQVLLPTMP